MTPSALAGLGLQPLSMRSVLLSTLLGSNPPRLRAAQLIAMASVFGFSAAQAESSLAVLAATGDVTIENHRYRLGPRLARRQRRQDQTRTDPRLPWGGRWAMVVLDRGSEDLENADELRRELLGLQFALWREGVWLRPDNLGLRHVPMLQQHATTWVTDAPNNLDGRSLVARLWDLNAWAGRAELLLEALPQALDLIDGLPVAIATIGHLTRDPLLPDGLSPKGWPSQTLRKEFARCATEIETELALFLRR